MTESVAGGAYAAVDPVAASQSGGEQPEMTRLAGGGFVLAWEVLGVGLQAQVYTAQGFAAGPKFKLGHEGTRGYYPSIAALPGGGFIAAWDGSSPSGLIATTVRSFDAAGTPLGDQFVANAGDTGHRQQAAIAVLADGGFVVSWTNQDSSGNGIFMRRFDASGTPLTGDIAVNSVTGGNQQASLIVALSNGGFVVAWLDTWYGSPNLPSDPSYSAQFFDSAGNRVGGEIEMAPGVYGIFDMVALASGNVVIVSPNAAGELSGRIYSPTGTPLGEPFQVNPSTAGAESMPDIAGLATGGFMVTWRVPTGEVNYFQQGDVWAQLFDASGGKVGDPFRVNPVTQGGQTMPQIVSFGTNDFAIVYQDFDANGAPTLRLRNLYSSDEPPPTDTSPDFTLADFSAEAGPVAVNISPFYVYPVGHPHYSRPLDPNEVLDGDGNYRTLVDIVNVIGTGGDDFLYGGIAANRLSGGAGNDFIHGYDGDDVLDAGAGDDIVRGGFGNDDLAGRDGNDQLFGDSGADLLSGGDGSDRLSGGSGADSYDGGAGIDTLDYSGEPGPVVVNLHHSLFVFPAGHPQGTRSVGPGEALDSYGNYESVSGIENVITTAGTDVVHGSDGVNRIETGAGNDRITGFGGNDVLLAGSGRDNVQGGDGDDAIDGGDDGDTLLGNADNDTIEGGGGNDVLFGGTGADILSGGAGDDQIRGEDGNDTLIGGDGADLIRGGSGVDSFDGGADGDGTGSFGPWGDRVSFFEAAATQGVVADLRTGIISNDGFGNTETMTGIESLGADTAFVDTFYGNDGVNFLYGGPGDFVFGFGGNDRFDAPAAGNIDGGDGSDSLFLFTHGGFLTQDADADGFAEVAGLATSGWTIDLEAETMTDGYGNAGTVSNVENVTGSELADTITGDEHDNVIDGGLGADAMTGRAGNDVYIVDNIGDVVTEAADEGTDEVRTALGSRNDPAAMYVLGANIENLTGISATDQGVFANALDNVVAMGAGNDLIVLQDGGIDRVSGGAGNDFLYYGSTLTAEDSNDGGAGFDTVGLSGVYNVTLGADTLVAFEKLAVYSSGDVAAPNSYSITTVNANVAAGATLQVVALSLKAGETLFFYGHAETDGSFNILSGAGNDLLVGGRSNDMIQGGNGDDLIYALNGNDVVSGGNGRDTVYGGGGDDRMTGGLGADILNGGFGNDTMVYAGPSDSTGIDFDTIEVFDPRIDKIDLPGAVSGWTGRVTAGQLSAASFDADLAAAVDGLLQANSAVLFTPDTGDFAGRTLAVIDGNGDGAYQTGSDFVIEFVNPLVPLDTGSAFFI